MRTRVGIVGGRPAGLLLSHLLHLKGTASKGFKRGFFASRYRTVLAVIVFGLSTASRTPEDISAEELGVESRARA